MASIFTKIVNGEIPAYKVAEDEKFLAFLDISPVAKGHTLVLFDLGDELYSGLQLFAKKVAAGLKKTVPCIKVGMLVLGLEVPHAHVHLVPIDRIADIDFALARPAEAADLAALAEKIKAASPDLPA